VTSRIAACSRRAKNSGEGRHANAPPPLKSDTDAFAAASVADSVLQQTATTQPLARRVHAGEPASGSGTTAASAPRRAPHDDEDNDLHPRPPAAGGRI
jgi:hypothetical protein